MRRGIGAVYGRDLGLGFSVGRGKVRRRSVVAASAWSFGGLWREAVANRLIAWSQSLLRWVICRARRDGFEVVSIEEALLASDLEQ